MNPISKYFGTIRTLFNTKQVERCPEFVIKKRHSLKPKYYQATFWDYQWVSNINKATVFRSEVEIEREINATWVQYEDLYDIVSL